MIDFVDCSGSTFEGAGGTSVSRFGVVDLRELAMAMVPVIGLDGALGHRNSCI